MVVEMGGWWLGVLNVRFALAVEFGSLYVVCLFLKLRYLLRWMDGARNVILYACCEFCISLGCMWFA